MKSFRIFRPNMINSFRSISTNPKRFYSKFENTAASFMPISLNEDNNQNPLKYINQLKTKNVSPANKRHNAIFIVNNGLIKFLNLKKNNSQLLFKRKIVQIEEDKKKVSAKKKPYMIRNKSQYQSAEQSQNYSLLAPHTLFSTTKSHNSKAELKTQMIHKVLSQRVNTNNLTKLSITSPTMKRINYLAQLHNKSYLTISKPKESRNNPATLQPEYNCESTTISQNQRKTPAIISFTHKDKASNNINQLAILQNILKAYRGKTKAGKNENNMSKVNQDSFLMITSLYNMIDFNVFGVFDGHGVNGHLVSDFAKEYFKQALMNHKDLCTMSTIEEIYAKLIDQNYALIHNLFKAAEVNLFKETFDSLYSGTSAVIVLHVGTHLICANAGDSRAILIEDHDKSNKQYQVTPLSFDHKPNLLIERKRIEKLGGRVEQYSELGIRAGPYRVWLRKEDYPGLAMSRSIGDLLGSTIGVINEPDIVEYDILPTTRYVIIASDGVWEFIDNEKAMNVTKLFYQNNNPEGLCSNLIYEAIKIWKKEDTVIDDITVITLFFNK